MHALPGVQSAGAGFGMPLTNFGFGFSFTIAGRPPLRPQDEPDARGAHCDAGLFLDDGHQDREGPRLHRSRSRRRREGAAADRSGGEEVFPGRRSDRQTRDVRLDARPGAGVHLEGDIVGIVADVKQSSLAATTLPQFWAPYDQWPMSNMNVVLHTTRDPQAVVADARAAIKQLDPDLAIAQVKTLDASPRRVRRAAALLYGAAHRVRDRRDRALGDRDLRRHCVSRRPALARTRHSHRARRDADARRAHGRARRRRDGRSRHRRRDRGRARAHAG